MQDKHLYEYSIIRYVPRVEREEFVNVGLIMMCKRQRWLRCSINGDFTRVAALRPQHSIDEIRNQLSGFGIVADNRAEGLQLSGLEAEERFRWLTSVRSTCIQTSRPHPGLCDDLDDTFEKLFEELVL